jgi:ribonuclease BN (tRNA processing enzyme)
MDLVALGVGGGWARAGGAACGYLARSDGYALWIDAGTGTMANLQRHAELGGVDAVAVSHRHFDHFLDLYPYFLALRLDPERGSRKVPLFAPPGMFQHALQLEGDLGEVFDPQVIEPGATFEAGPFLLHTAPMRHPVPTLGMRIEAGGEVLAYTADTGPCDEAVELARGAHVLLSEATWLDPHDGIGPIHLTAAEAGRLAASADAARLVLTHIWPATDRARVAERAAAAFGGPVLVAEEGMVLRPGGEEPADG